MLKTYVDFFLALVTDEEGASAVEYGLILGLIAVAIVGILLTIGMSVDANVLIKDTELGTAAAGAGG